MPCNDWNYNNNRVEYRDNPRTEAILCAAFKYIEKFASFNAFLRFTDWEEQGVSVDEARKWWEQHQKKDAARKEQERKAADLRKKKEAAIKRLTAEERKLLKI